MHALEFSVENTVYMKLISKHGKDWSGKSVSNNSSSNNRKQKQNPPNPEKYRKKKKKETTMRLAI